MFQYSHKYLDKFTWISSSKAKFTELSVIYDNIYETNGTNITILSIHEMRLIFERFSLYLYMHLRIFGYY